SCEAFMFLRCFFTFQHGRSLILCTPSHYALISSDSRVSCRQVLSRLSAPIKLFVLT
ncbi:hypothetical protein L0F63_005358, partial [Massospora cicadina]